MTKKSTLGSTYYENATEFNASSEDWNSYIESLELFLESNSIEQGRRQLILLSTIGAET